MRQWLAVGMIASAVACGSDDGNKATDALAVSADPAGVTVTPGTDQTVVLTLTRSGSVKGAAALTVSSAADLTATFDNAAPTGDTATLTIAASASAVPATKTLTVTATANGLSDAVSIDVTIGPAPTITVSGKLLGGNVALGINNIGLSLWSAGASTAVTTATGADGSFTFTGVTAPYDLTASFDNYTTTYLGLSSATPTLASAKFSKSSGRSVNPTLPAGTTGHHDGFIIDCPQAGTVLAYVTSTSSAPLGELFLPGFATGTPTCTAELLRYSDALPITYEYVSQSFALDGGSLVMNPLNSLASQLLTVTASYAPGFLTHSAQVVWNPAHYSAVLFGAADATTGPFGFNIPTSTDLKFTVQISASDGGGATTTVYRRASGLSSLTVNLPSPVALIGPAPGATEIDPAAAQLQAAGQTGEGYRFAIALTGNSSFCEVFTAQPSLALSVIAARGIPINHNTSYDWGVTGFSDITTMDDFADGASTPHTYGSRDGVIRSSLARTFTTKVN